jgi:hypothetical protein
VVVLPGGNAWWRRSAVAVAVTLVAPIASVAQAASSTGAHAATPGMIADATVRYQPLFVGTDGLAFRRPGLAPLLIRDVAPTSVGRFLAVAARTRQGYALDARCQVASASANDTFARRCPLFQTFATAQPPIYTHPWRNPLVSAADAYTIQYWVFYAWNQFVNASTGPFGTPSEIWDFHQGDWEMVQVAFDRSLRPRSVAASQHGCGQRIAWSDRRLTRSGSHPVIDVAAGSHANYFAPGRYSIDAVACRLASGSLRTLVSAAHRAGFNVYDYAVAAAGRGVWRRLPTAAARLGERAGGLVDLASVGWGGFQGVFGRAGTVGVGPIIASDSAPLEPQRHADYANPAVALAWPAA